MKGLDSAIRHLPYANHYKVGAMALIKCPSCGHGVLSVASQCPQCAAVLTKAPHDLGASGELTECRDCGRAVLSRAAACGNCGARHPAQSYVPKIAGALVGLLAVVGWITTAALKPPTHGFVSHVSIVARANATPADSKVARPSPVPTKVAELKPAPAKLIFVTPQDTKTVARPTMVASRSAPRPAVLASSDSVASTQAKKVAAWANVRQEPSVDAAVVQVLRPGQQIDVVQRRGGWWAVYTEGRRLGYVSRTLLVDDMGAESERPVSN